MSNTTTFVVNFETQAEVMSQFPNATCEAFLPARLNWGTEESDAYDYAGMPVYQNGAPQYMMTEGVRFSVTGHYSRTALRRMFGRYVRGVHRHE
jgi:hypothetical protein